MFCTQNILPPTLNTLILFSHLPPHLLYKTNYERQSNNRTSNSSGLVCLCSKAEPFWSQITKFLWMQRLSNFVSAKLQRSACFSTWTQPLGREKTRASTNQSRQRLLHAQQKYCTRNTKNKKKDYGCTAHAAQSGCPYQTPMVTSSSGWR